MHMHRWRERESMHVHVLLVFLYCTLGLSRSMDSCTEHLVIQESLLYKPSEPIDVKSIKAKDGIKNILGGEQG